jgi:hypothetical protein
MLCLHHAARTGVRGHGRPICAYRDCTRRCPRSGSAGGRDRSRRTQRTYQTVLLNGVFGALRDAGPDYWGRRVIDRRAKPSLASWITYSNRRMTEPERSLSGGSTGTPVKRRVRRRAARCDKLASVHRSVLLRLGESRPFRPNHQGAWPGQCLRTSNARGNSVLVGVSYSIVP